MHLDLYRNGLYRILKITDTITASSKLEELRSLIKCYLSSDELFLAVGFTEASYLYSGAISVLVSCYKMVREKGGDLCIIEPKPELLSLLHQMGIDALINIYTSEQDLPNDPAKVKSCQTGSAGSESS